MKCFKGPDKPMASTITSIMFYILLCLEFYPAKAQTLIRVGYWDSTYKFPISSINSSLFTHLICFSTKVDSTSYEQYVSPTDEEQFSKFTEIARQKNPSVTTLLSVGGRDPDYSTLFKMMSESSSRKSFIDSSIRLARLYGFQGLDFAGVQPMSGNDSVNIGKLYDEWRAAIDSEARNSSHTQLILTAIFGFTPLVSLGNHPVESMQRCLDWVHMATAEYKRPDSTDSTSVNAALYDPGSSFNTDYAIRMSIDAGLSADKLVLSLPYYGYAWTLVNPEDNHIGAPATGPAITANGFMQFKEIKSYIMQYGSNARVMYNDTYVVNYCTIGTTWIGFDDVEAIRAKVSYIEKKKLLGYHVWQVPYDNNWLLSRVAAGEDNQTTSSPPVNNRNGQGNSKRQLFVITSTSVAAFILLMGFSTYCCWIRKLHPKGTDLLANFKQSKGKLNKAGAGDLSSNGPNLTEYTLDEMEEATNRFSIHNKLGQGGYGPVYKGILPNGQAIAVKKLSKTSTQGFEEFKNEVILTAKLQHVNLVRVLGFCIDREEQMLIYEYMPNKSLDCYLFDPVRRFILDWTRRVHIIEGITQGFLYLQEYSRLTVIHRDLKASNILLDKDMKAKISDFGMAKIFIKEDLEANTERIVGTHGYIPPEYIRRGIYSTKSDVYSFGVLLLQIISGKRISILYGPDGNLSLLEYAYEMWRNSKGVEFVDSSLDDTHSSCKLMRCLQVALLCVQENPNDRPSMLEISSMLKNETEDINTPKKPAFSTRAYEDDEQKKSMMQVDMFSVNDVTISEVVAR